MAFEPLEYGREMAGAESGSDLKTSVCVSRPRNEGGSEPCAALDRAGTTLLRDTTFTWPARQVSTTVSCFGLGEEPALDLDLARHKEFLFSRDGAYVAVGICKLGDNTKPEVCVIRVSDSKRFDLPDVSYDYGGRRLEIDPETRMLFSGAYYKTGIAAYDFESGTTVWERRDLKQLGELAYDAFEGVVYCLCERRTVLLTKTAGKERAYHTRGLKDVFFGKDPNLAVFHAAQTKLLNRAAKTEHVLPKATGNILRVAFTQTAAVITWVAGPVIAYALESGRLLWTYKPDGTHAYSLAVASDNASVWVAEQPGYQEQPWHRVRLLSSSGEIKQEVRCALGHSFEIAPYSDSAIRGNLVVTPVAALGSS